MMKKLLLICICVTVAVFSSGQAFAAGSDGAVAVSKLEMKIKNISLKSGQSRNISVVISPSTADDKTLIWSTGDTSVATVSSASASGRAAVTAIGEGKTKITATSHNGKTAVCTVTVSDDEIEVRRIEMTEETATIKINQKKILPVTFTPRTAEDKSIAWYTDNPNVVTVEDDGIITGISAGTAEITAMSANGKTAVCTVTVTSQVFTETKQKAESTYTVTASYNTSISNSISIIKGKTKDLSGYVKYKELYKDRSGEWHTEWQLVGKITWASSFPDVVSINDKGIATAHRAGISKITATGFDENGQKCVQTIVVGVSAK